MLLHMLLAFSLGIEGGYHIPAVGFQNINTGNSFSVYTVRNVGFVDLTLALKTAFYTGDNASYNLNATGLRLGVQKSNWPISPVLAIGGDYVSRALGQNSESGFALAYSMGMLLNFRIDRLSIHPKFYYDGLTDMKTHAGFIGLKLGIGYEI
ncbi:hypothetical protein AMJ74_02430 [candidate division WOR_3 bacterium SM1_77]|jgi:hypothetical protein|uniref:Outer membrane protein beta-barrel domain-containing protein n=1 Tax=candidate division WOR_3 bacterium SM1_77 TaxID=1703778 RepID=A0A0S8JYY0_UNCW3|nr:MAG: hypothetical protein AMJ74_02430 [candidate division WOR_3 bacterium SM1_77]